MKAQVIPLSCIEAAPAWEVLYTLTSLTDDHDTIILTKTNKTYI